MGSSRYQRAVATGLPGGLLIYSADEATPVEHEIPLAGKRLRITTLDLRDGPEQILRRVHQLARQIRRLRAEAPSLSRAWAA